LVVVALVAFLVVAFLVLIAGIILPVVTPIKNRLNHDW
jgi:hypothetical protein